jgi:hypothetical protein
MANKKLTKEKRQEVIFNGITVGDLAKVINSTNEFLKIHKGIISPTGEQKDMKEKAYRAASLAQSLLIVGLSQSYCEFARTINDVNPDYVKKRLQLDFEIANK